MYTYKNKTFTSRKIKKLKPKSNDQGAVAANEYMDSRNEKGDAARMQVVNGLRSSDQINGTFTDHQINGGHKCSFPLHQCYIRQDSATKLNLLPQQGLQIISKIILAPKREEIFIFNKPISNLKLTKLFLEN